MRTIIRRPVQDQQGRLAGYQITTYTPVTPQAPRQVPQPVTLAAIQAVLTTALDARDCAFDTRLALARHQSAQQAARQPLLTALHAQGFTAQECAGMPLTTLRKVAQTLQAADEAAWPDDAPAWR